MGVQLRVTSSLDRLGSYFSAAPLLTGELFDPGMRCHMFQSINRFFFLKVRHQMTQWTNRQNDD